MLIVLAAVVGLAFHAAMYGPQAAFITELFGTEVRCSGASLGYQLAGILGGARANRGGRPRRGPPGGAGAAGAPRPVFH